MLVYLGGPIDLVKEGERHEWRSQIKEVLLSHNVSSLDPAAAFSVNLGNHDTMKKLININKHNMMNSDLVLLIMSPDKASIGTPMELLMLIEHNERVRPKNATEFVDRMIKQQNNEYIESPIDFLVVWNPIDSPSQYDIGKTLNSHIARFDSEVVDELANGGYSRTYLTKELPAYISGHTDRVVSSFRDVLTYIAFKQHKMEDKFFQLGIEYPHPAPAPTPPMPK